MLVVLHEGCDGQTRKTAVYQIWVQCQQTGLCLLEKFEVYLHLPKEKSQICKYESKNTAKLNLGGKKKTTSESKLLTGLFTNTFQLTRNEKEFAKFMY